MFHRVLDHCLEIPTLAPTHATHSIVRLTILYVFVPQVRADVFACNTSLGFCEEMRQWQRAFSCMLHMKASKQVGIRFSQQHKSTRVKRAKGCKRFISHGMCTLAISRPKRHEVVGPFHDSSCRQVPDEISHLIALDEILK